MAACSSQETGGALQRQVRDLPPPGDSGVPAARTYLPGRAAGGRRSSRCSSSRASAAAASARSPIRNRRELDFFLDYVDEPVVQEYLAGPEYTIDVLCDFERTAAVHRAARARGDSRRRHRPRPHGEDHRR